MEYSPMEELGFREEKQLISGCHRIISSNDYAKDLCSYLMKNGSNFYDVISRYEDVASYVLSRDTEQIQPTMKMLIPFLKASGLTDHMAYRFAYDDLELFPGAAESFQYIHSLMPMFISTSSYEHHTMAVSDASGIPLTNFSSTRMELDDNEMDRQEARDIRGMINDISSLRVPDTKYTFEEGEILCRDDTEIIEKLDDIFRNRLPKTEYYKKIKDDVAISANEKSYSLLEIRRKTDIEFSNTVYVGSELNDYLALDLVRDSEGLAISFNGTDRAVQTSNVCVMSKSATPIAVLAAEFYDKGIESVYDMIDNWDRKKLCERPCADRNLMDRFLTEFPKKLPVVKRITRSNADEVSEESEAYRKKVAKCVKKY